MKKMIAGHSHLFNREPIYSVSSNHTLNLDYNHHIEYKDLINQSTDQVVFTGTLSQILHYINDFLINEYNWSLCLQGFFTAPNGDEYLIEKTELC